MAGHISDAELEALRAVPDRVRQRGYAVGLGHRVGAHLETVTTRVNQGDPQVSREVLRDTIVGASTGYNVPGELPDRLELRLVTAPVFGHDGRVAFTLTLWGPAGEVSRDTVEEYGEALQEAAAAATRCIARAGLR